MPGNAKGTSVVSKLATARKRRQRTQKNIRGR